MANGFQRSIDAYVEDKTVAVRLGCVAESTTNAIERVRSCQKSEQVVVGERYGTPSGRRMTQEVSGRCGKRCEVKIHVKHVPSAWVGRQAAW